ncbi:recombinase family protein [Acidithiobacillus ferrooxidans]|uniref:recombinase family protein n=1 Tax=Acidithiobacillus ferrooxidans TaxID=920 RepID=UPI00214BEDB0|nr:recombinase family protein [Acidithiobacillus ferrooxidans]MCR2831955.1 recombinase family protein [Acidithiobacillus ferrooxidans]
MTAPTWRRRSNSSVLATCWWSGSSTGSAARLSHLLAIVTSLKDKRVAFRSLTENLDTTTPSGEFLFQVFGALAQYERALIQERVVAGLAAARKRGRIGGRPQAITGEKLDAIIAALDGDMSKAAVCRNFNVNRATLIALRYFPLPKPFACAVGQI